MIPKNLPGTITLVAVSVLVYLITLTGFAEPTIRALLISEYIRPALPEIRNGEFWRLLTPMFLHFGIFHIVFNMLWTWELGRIIEWRHGITRFIGITIIISVISNYTQYRISGPSFGGMSAVIYGYFGYIWLQGVINPRFGIRINPAIVKLLFGWFLICWTGLLETLLGIQVANTAHTAGLVCGLLIALLYGGFERLRRA